MNLLYVKKLKNKRKKDFEADIKGYIAKPGGVHVLESSLHALFPDGGEVKKFETVEEFMVALDDVNNHREEPLSQEGFIRHFDNYIKNMESQKDHYEKFSNTHSSGGILKQNAISKLQFLESLN